MRRQAQCACGAVRVITEGEPSVVIACHCVACQRRTGSVFGAGAYWPEEKIGIVGGTRKFSRSTDQGNTFTTHFCPTCATSMYWSSDRNLGAIGVAVGAFADPDFPVPVRSVWEQTKHAWVGVDVAQYHFRQGSQG